MKITLPNISGGNWHIHPKYPNIVQVEDESGWGCTVADCGSGSLDLSEKDANTLATSALPECLQALAECLALIDRNADFLAGVDHPNAVNSACDKAQSALLKSGATIE